MTWSQLQIEEVEEKLQVNREKGLTAEQIVQRQKKFGFNEVQSDKGVSNWLLFIHQFQDFMVLVLLAATLVAGVLGEYIDAIAIMIIVLINACIGFFQERKAEKSLEKLQALSAPMASVLRENNWQQIPSKDIVVGDIVRLRSGDRIPADIRLFQSSSLKTEEATLTGESLPVSKHTEAIEQAGLEAQDQLNIGFMGTMVAYGAGQGIVVGTGMNTVIGQIATLMSETKKTVTPLEYKLAELGKVLIAVVLVLTGLVVGIGVFQGHPVYDMFLAGASLAVAAIPEGLPAIVTVALSLGVQRMIRRKAIVRKLSAVETLGCTSIICTDKTGTITENQMTVKTLFLNNTFLSVSGDGYDPHGAYYVQQKKVGSQYPNLKSMLLYGQLCNHAALKVKQGKYIVDGDPTDGALLVAAKKMGMSDENDTAYRIIKDIPFDSDRKRMSVIIEDDNKQRFLITKGAPEVILPHSTYHLSHNGRQKLTDQTPIYEAVEQMAEKALRTIAIAIKPLFNKDTLDPAWLEKDLTFVGLYGLMDPPRREVKGAIAQCRDAGIKTVMITGDHAKTAEAIATQIDLLPENGLIVEGYELNQMSVDELANQIDDIYVFARVTPEHKLKIVQAFQDKGHIVAMTGDGVNDAPAIKASDIGIGMGRTGTDVTKEASSLLLMDDNFATIKEAIKEGRNIYENIRKFIRYLLASNVGEILVMLFAMMLALPLPLVPIQILWVNLVTDGLPAMALGLDKPEADTMRKQPRNPREGIFARGLGFQIVSRGLLIGLVTLIAFMLAYDDQPDQLIYGQTIAFSTLVMSQLIHVFDCRSEKSVFSRNPFENIYLIGAVLSSFLLLLVVIYWEPLQPVFYTTFLDMTDWLLIVALSMIPTVLFGFTKK